MHIDHLKRLLTQIRRRSYIILTVASIKPH